MKKDIDRFSKDIKKAMKLSFEKHKGMFDKAGMPYIFHIERVAQKAVTQEEIIVSYLHDLIEDTDITAKKLREYGFSKDIVFAVECLTRPKEISLDAKKGISIKKIYNDNIYLKQLQQSTLALRVKLYDLEDNMRLSRLKSIKQKDLDRYERYKKLHQTIQILLQNED